MLKAAETIPLPNLWVSADDARYGAGVVHCRQDATVMHVLLPYRWWK